MHYWFCITNPWNWLKVESNATWGVDDRYKITLERVRPQDLIVFYATNLPTSLGKTLKQMLGPIEWTKLISKVAQLEKAIVGIYRATGTCYYDESDIGWLTRDGTKPLQNFPHRIKITSIYPRPIVPIPLSYKFGRTLLEELLFLPDKSKSYYNILYPSMLSILEEDFLTIKKNADILLQREN
jgi:predicted RNA-binding protein